MEDPYDKIMQQTVSRILLANMWRENGFYDFAVSTIVQAYEAVERFQRRLDGMRFGHFQESPSLTLHRACEEFKFSDNYSDSLIRNIGKAVREMELAEVKNA